MSGLSKDKLIFDPADAADSDNIGAYLRAGSDGDLLSSTNVGGKEGLDVNLITASVEVTATDLDIRDLAFATDSVDVSGSSVTVSATDLDVRDLTHVSDSVKIGDGTDFLAVNADGSINVSAILNSTYAEDSAHSSGDFGNFVMAVRNDASSSLVDTDGDYAPLQVDATGRLKVAADLVSSAEYAEDAAHSSGDIGNFMLSVRQDALASSTSTDGDYAAIKVDSRGAMWSAPVGTAADDAADSEAPVKVGSRAISGALAAVSAGNDRADAISDMYRRIYINDSPNIGVASQVLTVGATEVAFPTALAGRRRLMLQNTSSNPVYVGPTGLSTSDGLKVEKGATLTLEVGENVDLFAIAGSAGNAVRIFELA